MKVEIRKCKNCGKDFKWTELFMGQKFCGNKCFNEYHDKLKENKGGVTTYKKVCNWCKKEFETPSNSNAYCSPECKISGMRAKKVNNGNAEAIKEFIEMKVKILIERALNGVEASNGREINYYNIPFPPSVRDEVLIRDKYECQICGASTNLHVHHIVPRVFGGNHDTDNLITLCCRCHRHIETRDIPYASKKCFENTVKMLSDTNKSKISYKDIVSVYENNLNELYAKLANLNNDEVKEIVKELDMFMSNMGL